MYCKYTFLPLLHEYRNSVCTISIPLRSFYSLVRMFIRTNVPSCILMITTMTMTMKMTMMIKKVTYY